MLEQKFSFGSTLFVLLFFSDNGTFDFTHEMIRAFFNVSDMDYLDNLADSFLFFPCKRFQ